jgi:cobalamin biosynthesis Co2+ chelatase CbiK
LKAFPNLDYHLLNQGMDLRDYFAAKAMQGICVSKDEAGTLINHGYEWIASEAYSIADAMMKARKQ